MKSPNYFHSEGIVYEVTDTANNIAEPVTSDLAVQEYWMSTLKADMIEAKKDKEAAPLSRRLLKLGGMALAATALIGGSYVASYVGGDAAIKFGTFRQEQVTVPNLKTNLEKNIEQQMDHFLGGDN